MDLETIYKNRFEQTGLQRRQRVWKILCANFFQSYVREDATILDLACGYGEFINNIRAGVKYAVDLNPNAKEYLSHEVRFRLAPGNDLGVDDASLDAVFTSNFLEHLQTKEECTSVLSEVFSKLKPGGRFLILGPNIRYAYKEYWDYYDHYLALSHLSLTEALRTTGYDVDHVVPRFLPYTMNNNIPAHPTLVRIYLKMPLAWRIVGKQFFVVARKPSEP